MDRESADARTALHSTQLHSTPLQPDTEPSGPLSQADSHISTDLESLGVTQLSVTAPSPGTETSPGNAVPPKTAASPQNATSPKTAAPMTAAERDAPSASGVATRDDVDLSITTQSRLSPMASHKAKLPLNEDSNTTLQSMKRPEVSSTGGTQTRRFLSIERDLEQMNATIKLLEKRCARAEKDVKIAWIVAGIGATLGLLSTLL